MGADVPAVSFELSPMDRVFVRMGAMDNIMGGQSTFLVELAETATMLVTNTHNDDQIMPDDAQFCPILSNSAG